MRPIDEVARDLGIEEDAIVHHGKWIAKIPVGYRVARPRNGRLILVTAITPTPYGEGKTVVSVGLSMGLNRIGLRTVACIRQPSIGPVFGVKGGGAGGGRTTLEPMQQVNLRFTGDIDAVTAAHNLIAAMVDNHIFQGNELGIDPASIVWPRAEDMNDRALRDIVVGQTKGETPHRSRFVITAASELMAVLCLCTGYGDLKKRVGAIIVAYTAAGAAVTVSQLKCVGAVAALLRDALQPNLAQTAEGTPALVHGGPFGNIAHGTCSIMSIGLGLQLANYVVVEAGFGSDLGAEKFIDIVSRIGGFSVDAAVVVASMKALRFHGGSTSGSADPQAVRRGLVNLAKHIENVRLYGLSPVVAINRFAGDSEAEFSVVEEHCRGMGVRCVVTTAFTEGSKGAEELARAVVDAAARGSNPTPVYSLELPTSKKIEAVVTKVYGGRGVTYTPEAERDLKRIAELGIDGLPICMSKTPLSLSDDASKIGMPTDFVVTVMKVQPSAGAGFNVVHLGSVVTMPGLPKVPQAEKVELSDDGLITGVQ